ncbi:MAG: DedA family protein, partial [Deltaproteobacteria bacterium]
MEHVLDWLVSYQYAAMVGLLALCGIGLPLPEEFTLLASGLLVGWGEANFWLASCACSVGILLGDAMIFWLGRGLGKRFLRSRPMLFLMPAHRQAHAQGFFARHGGKALFFARFVPGVRICIYAYAGAQQTRWSRFCLLDGLGVLMSGPTSIWVGRWAALALAGSRQE